MLFVLPFFFLSFSLLCHLSAGAPRMRNPTCYLVCSRHDDDKQGVGLAKVANIATGVKHGLRSRVYLFTCSLLIFCSRFVTHSSRDKLLLLRRL